MEPLTDVEVLPMPEHGWYNLVETHKRKRSVGQLSAGPDTVSEPNPTSRAAHRRRARAAQR